jgi:predicted Zn-dependent protease
MPSGSSNTRPIEDIVGLPTIVQILLLSSAEAATSLGPTLWAVLEEVETLYNHQRQRAVFARQMMVNNNVAAAESEDKLEERFGDVSEHDLPALRAEAEGVYLGTLNAERLAELVRKQLAVPDRRRLFILTEHEITPPKDWAYILWLETPAGTVVSTAALDPDYWGIQEPDRLKVIKHRARAACMAATGILLGFNRCDNPSCYLFTEVDSVTRLDLMVAIGPEHEEIAGDEAIGYWKTIEDPEMVEAIARPEDLEVGGWPVL